jgi:hypothetical protein
VASRVVSNSIVSILLTEAEILSSSIDRIEMSTFRSNTKAEFSLRYGVMSRKIVVVLIYYRHKLLNRTVL